MIKFLPDDIADSYAIKALFTGTANAGQQTRAMKCLIEEICNTYGMTYDPQSERQSAFNEGMRHVGRVLVGIANISLGQVKKAEELIEKRKTFVKSKGRPNG